MSLSVRRSTATLMAVLILAATIGFVFTAKAKPAAAAGTDTPVQFASGQVFASVGNSAVKVFSQGQPAATPPTLPTLAATLSDGLGETFTAGSAFDQNGNLYVADDYLGDIVEYSSSGAYLGVFASGLQNPLSVAFDNSGNLYVGQQSVDTIAEYNSSGSLVQNIGPVPVENAGTDWITLADQCTIDYTSESTDILSWNMCTNTPGPNVNAQPFPTNDPVTNQPTNQAYEAQVRPNGQVLVADSSQDILLNADGTVAQTYSCSSFAPYGAGCDDNLFTISLDPNGSTFWTGDSVSGYIWQVDIATGNVLQTINAKSGTVYGLSVANQIEVAGPTPTFTVAPAINIQPLPNTISPGTPATFSAVLTNSSTSLPVPSAPVTFTLSGSPPCTTNTDATGTATCTITPGQQTGSYTLVVSFNGDTTLSSDTVQTPVTITPASTVLTYTGPATAINGQPFTPSATLTPAPGGTTSLAGSMVTFSIGSVPYCSGIVQADGTVSCMGGAVAETTSSQTVTTSFGPTPWYAQNTTTTPLTVFEPTILTVSPANGEYSDSGQNCSPAVTGSPGCLTGTLTDANTGNPIAGVTGLTFTVTGNGTETETCTTGVPTDANGMASCAITPMEPQGVYTVTGTFTPPPNQNVPLQLAAAQPSSAPFNEGLEETGLALNGAPYSVMNGQNLAVSATLTTDSGTVPVAGRALTFTLGNGATAQTCTTAAPGTNSTGTAGCTITNVNQAVGVGLPISVNFAGDTTPGASYYAGSMAQNLAYVPTGTTLSVTNASGDYNDATTVYAKLIDNYTGQPPATSEPVTITLNGMQSCVNVMTNASGVASCQITPNEKAGSYSLTATFAGDTSVLPHLDASAGSGTFVVTLEQTSLSYTGATPPPVNGSSTTLSGVLTTDDPAPGAPIGGRTVTFTLGSGASAQTCGGVTNSSGAVSCVINKVNQATSPVTVTDNFAGDPYFLPANGSGSVTIQTPTVLTVNAGTGTYGQTTPLTGTLTNAVTGAPISGQTVTLTLNGTQSCTAVTNAMGKASCNVTPNEPGATYTVSGTFAGSTSTTVLLPSSGHNCFVVNKAPTTLTYTGPTQVFYGGTITLTSTLTSNGAPLPGQPVVLTLGTGRTAESCTATTSSTGVASCTVPVNQIPGSVAVTVTYAGNGNYQSSSTTSGEQIGCGGGGQGGGSGGGGSGGGCGGSGGGQGGGCLPPCGSRGTGTGGCSGGGGGGNCGSGGSSGGGCGSGGGFGSAGSGSGGLSCG